MPDLQGRVAIVTGAAQGIGLAIAKDLAAQGAAVAACDLAHCPNQEFARCYQVDLTDTDALAPLVATVESDLGPVSMLVNAAGVCTTQPATSVTPESWARTIATNSQAPFFLARECAERMKERRSGSIVNVASVSGFIPKLEQIDYGASKAALVSLTRSLALVYGPHGVRVNAVAPGVIDTPLTSQIAQQRAAIRGVEPEETLRPVIEATPLRRIGTPQEVADLVSFLLSDKSSFVTGQTVCVCGGFLMR